MIDALLGPGVGADPEARPKSRSGKVPELVIGITRGYHTISGEAANLLGILKLVFARLRTTLWNTGVPARSK